VHKHSTLLTRGSRLIGAELDVEIVARSIWRYPPVIALCRAVGLGVREAAKEK
jgi:hypothetical protein